MRLFVGIRLPADVRSVLEPGLARLREAAPLLRWTSPAQWHLTLRFLGERDDAFRARLGPLLDSEASGHAPVTIELGDVGAFPSLRRPRVVWLGVGSGDSLAALQRAVERACGDAGAEPEGRAFHAHLTLARVRPGTREETLRTLRTAAASMTARAEFRATAVTLFESIPAAGGSRYEVRHEAPLLG